MSRTVQLSSQLLMILSHQLIERFVCFVLLSMLLTPDCSFEELLVDVPLHKQDVEVKVVHVFEARDVEP